MARRRYRARHWTPEQAAGRLGEDLAHRLLRRHGYRVVARNYHPPGGAGEIDLVARHGEDLIVVEVKTRATGEFGTPERAVTSTKEHDLGRAARDYARRAGIAWERVRFDLVTVLLSNPPEIQWQKDVFR